MGRVAQGGGHNATGKDRKYEQRVQGGRPRVHEGRAQPRRGPRQGEDRNGSLEAVPGAAAGIASAATPQAAAKAAKAAAKAAPKAAPKTEAAAVPKKGLSLLNAAATVLERSGEAMPVRAMIEEAKASGLWTPTGGKTPEQTLYSAIIREIKDKGGTSRFRKDGRGRFSFAR